MRASAVAVVLLGCGAGTKPSAAPEPFHAGGGGGPTLASSPTALASAPVVNGRPALTSVRLEAQPAAQRGPRSKVEIQSPVFAETLAELGLRKQEVRLAVEPSPLPPDKTLLVSFDGLRPRAAGTNALVLGDLIPEDRTVEPGVHSLLAVVVDADGRAPADTAFALVDFYVGRREGSLPRPGDARLFCLSPTGTAYGAASDRLLLQLFAVGGGERTVPLEIEAGAGAFAALVDPKLSYRVLGLPAGDVRLRAGRTQGPRAECVVTLNPEREGS